jgi:TonB family protein
MKLKNKKIRVMNNYVSWLLESGISLALFYLVYRIFLNRENQFQSNRGFLLFALLFSVTLPFIQIPSPIQHLHYSHYLPGVEITANMSLVSTETGKSLSLLQMIWLVYVAGAVLMFSVFVFRLIELIRIIKYNSSSKKGRIRIITTELDHSPFSFLNFLVINDKQLSTEQKEKIIEHESVHIRQFHTIDILIVELFVILQWFNPFVWLYKSSLKELHEYLADRELIRKGTNVPVYQQLLLNFQIRRQFLTLTNNFNYSLTKKRFIMMTKTKTSAFAGIKMAIMLPLVLTIILSLTKLNASGTETLEKYSPPPPPPPPASQQKSDDTGKSLTEEIFVVVEQMPKFNEADENGSEFRKYIAENLVYPKEAAKSGIQGRVFVQFIIDSEGFIKDAKVIRSVHELLDAEALKIVESSPKWIPGKQRGKEVNVQFTFPINFVLEKDKKE